jgi:hypothetical protein
MRKTFLTTRSHYEKTKKQGGVASISYGFFGVKAHSKAVDVSDKYILSLIALKEGLEHLLENELTPCSLQIDSDATGIVKKFFNGSLPIELLEKYRPYLNEIRNLIPNTDISIEFKKAKDNAGQAMSEKASIDSQCAVQDFTLGMDGITPLTPEQPI